MKLVSSAIKFKMNDSDYWTVMCGLRHADILEQMFRLNIRYDKDSAVQGFWTSEDTFVDRYEAVYIAWEADQIKDQSIIVLFSEDVWPE